MHNSQIPNRGKVAKWLDDFIVSISGNKDEVNTVKTADINVFDLPKVVWNDETFYVLFDNEKGTAKLYNRFSNEVQTLQNVQSIEDVDKTLNSKQVVVTSEFDTELEKVIEADNLITSEQNDTMTNTTPEQVQPVPTPENPIPEQSQDSNQSQDPNSQTEVTASAEDYNYSSIVDLLKEFDSEAYYVGSSDEYVRFFVNGEKLNLKQAVDLANQIEDIKNMPDEKPTIDDDIEKVGTTLDYINRIAVLEEQVTNLVNTVEELKGQLYAHQDPGAIYDNNSVVEEQKHIEETSKETAEQISQDNSIDITTMEGRVSLINRLRNELQPIMDMPQEISEKIPESEETVEIEDTIDPTIETEEPIENNVEDVTPEITNETENSEEQNLEKSPENSEKDLENSEENKETEIEKDVVKLNARDSKIFKKAICPHCGEDKLTKCATVGSFVGIHCPDCTSEYAVNMNTEEIFKKILNDLEI